jgi:hypothetical protein
MYSKLLTLRAGFVRSPAMVVLLAALLLAALITQGCSSGTANPRGSGSGAEGGTNQGGGSAFGGSSGNAGSGANSFGGSGANGSGGSGAGVGTGGSAAGVGTGGSGTDGGIEGGGYITYATWHGYGWTGVGGNASINPPDFGDRTDFPLCASGRIEAGEDNVAMIGWNISQEQGDNPPTGTVAPQNYAEGGIFVSLSNPADTPLRIQIEGAAGWPTESWCAPITAGTNIFVPWTAFKTECWASTGTVQYTGTPIKNIIIMVPGALAPRDFNFCVNGLAEGLDPSGPVAPGCSIAGNAGSVTGALTGTISNLLGWEYVNTNQTYIVQNNAWNPTSGMSHVLSYAGRSFTVTTQTGSRGTSEAPVSFPSLFMGANNNRGTTNSNLPKRVGDLTSVPTGWSWSGNPGGEWNATYDVWFSDNSAGDQGPGNRSFLMVWFHKTSAPRPESDTPSSYTTARIAEKNWDVWYGNNIEGRPTISYVAQSSVNSWEFDLKAFIDHAKGSQGRPAQFHDGLFLTNIFAGFEIWSGGQNLRTNNFCAVVN